MSLDVNQVRLIPNAISIEFFRTVNFFDYMSSYLFLVPSFNHWYCYHCGFPCTFSFPYLWVIRARPPAVSYFWTNEHIWQNLHLLIYVLQFQLYPFRPFSICILSILWPIPHKIPLKWKLWSWCTNYKSIPNS